MPIFMREKNKKTNSNYQQIDENQTNLNKLQSHIYKIEKVKGLTLRFTGDILILRYCLRDRDKLFSVR